MRDTNEYWYLKGIEDFTRFLSDLTEGEDQKHALNIQFNAITNLLRRNYKLIKELEDK